tara:strand:+ start:876 stop:1595 length:720 start_codon:yes stop_codon:yes gene_type:complete
MSDILNTILQQKLTDRYTPKTNNNAGGMRGLLNMVNSPRGQDIATGLLAQSGYSPTPVNLGSAIGQANQYATQNQFKRDATELADITALSTATKGNKKSDFFQQLDMYNEISSIPEDQRSADQARTLSVLTDKITKDPTINDYKVMLADKYLKFGKLTDPNDLALESFLMKQDPFFQMIKQNMEDKNTVSNIKTNNTKTFDANAEISKMQNEMTTEEATKYFKSLSNDKQEAIKKIYNG